MILVDTSVWVDFLKRQPLFFPTLQTLIETQTVVAAGCVIGELLQGAKNSRERNVMLGYWENLPKRQEEGIWIEAALLSSTPKWFSQGIGLSERLSDLFYPNISVANLDSRQKTLVGSQI